MLVNCEGWSNEVGLGRSSNRWQDGSRVGRGGVGVAVSYLGMRHWPLTRTGLPSATLRDRWWCGQRDGSLSHVVVAWAAVWISLSLASHCLCLTSLFSFLFSSFFTCSVWFWTARFFFLFSFLHFFFKDFQWLLTGLASWDRMDHENKGGPSHFDRRVQVFFFCCLASEKGPPKFFFFWNPIRNNWLCWIEEKIGLDKRFCSLKNWFGWWFDSVMVWQCGYWYPNLFPILH